MRWITIDPPEGWKYGFPKAIKVSNPYPTQGELEYHLVANGYPMRLAVFGAKYCRIMITHGIAKINEER